MFDILEPVNAWLDEGQPLYIATVTKTWGSSPRRAGAKMVFRSDLSMIGSVSGGCIENAVIEEGLALTPQSQGVYLNYGVSDDTALNVGLSCGGEIHVFVEPMDKHWWQTLTANHLNERTRYVVTVVSGMLVGEKAIFDDHFQAIFCSDGVTQSQIERWSTIASECQTSQQIVTDEAILFVDVIQPQPHLMIVGGNHIAMPLAAMANILGYRISLIDPRTAFATDDRFPDVDTILHTYPDKALHQLGMDSQSYLVVLTHDPKIDDPALITALNANVPYVGVLSSRTTHEQRKTRLRDAGITDEQLNCIHTPIGLDIGSTTPEEIAVSIIAQIVSVRRTTDSQ